MAELLMLLTSHHLPLAAVGSNPTGDVKCFSCEEAIQLSCGRSVVLPGFPKELMFGGALGGRRPPMRTGESPFDLSCCCDFKPQKSFDVHVNEI